MSESMSTEPDSFTENIRLIEETAKHAYIIISIVEGVSIQQEVLFSQPPVRHVQQSKNRSCDKAKCNHLPIGNKHLTVL